MNAAAADSIAVAATASDQALVLQMHCLPTRQLRQANGYRNVTELQQKPKPRVAVVAILKCS